MSSLPHYAIKQRVTTIMVATAIVFFGVIAAVTLQKDLFPRLNFPQVTIVTDYVNAAPEEIETLVTKPLEEAISSTSGLRELKSISQEGKSTIFAAFGWNENIDFSALAVREKIDLVKERLPKESEDPIVLKFDPLARPVMILSVTGDMHPSDLKILSERILKENIEKVDGVASATVSGGLDREIQVEIDQGRLQSTGISILDVIDSIDNSNISYPAGSIKKGLYEYLIRTVGEFRSVAEIAYTVISTDTKDEGKRDADTFLEQGGEGSRDTIDRSRTDQSRASADRRLVLLKDIGAVNDGFKEKSSISRFNSRENVSISVRKQGSANTIEVAKKIEKELLFLQNEINNKGLHVEVVYDHSTFIAQAISNVRNAAIMGGIIAALVLFFFFRSWSVSLIVACAIPISVIGTFFVCQLHGITINMMSLGGLALGAGMIVDNSIVVIENIFRLREQGMNPVRASVQGANEVFWPVFSSTLTTIAVFLPIILFVPGVAGQLFKDLSWTVIYSLILSLIVAIGLVPMLATYVEVSKGAGSKAVHASKELMEKVKLYFSKKSTGQQNIVFLSLIGGAFGVFLVSILLFNSLEREVLPQVDQGQFLVNVNLPVGSTLEATDIAVRIIEQEASEISEVKHVSVSIGSSRSSKSGEVDVETLRSYQAIVLVTLNSKRKKSSKEVVQVLRDRLSAFDLRNTEIEYVLQGGEFEFASAGGKPIEVEIKGYDLEKLTTLADRVIKLLKNVNGVTEIMSDFGDPSPETKVEIDRKRAALYAISSRDISLTAKAGIEGAIATEYKEDGQEIDVRVRLQEKDRESIHDIGDLYVFSQSLEIPVPFKDVAKITQGFGPSEIKRKDQIRTIVIRAGIKKGFKESKILRAIDERLFEMERPDDYTADLVGKAREVGESFKRLFMAIVLALILTYMIMAAQFESFMYPLVIMFTVPLAMIGVTTALWITGTAVSVIALLGILILAGTVVNNSIVLVDFINRQRREGMELVEACVESSFVRFRPILMSTLTTVVGLIPLAIGIGKGTELQSPLAIAMMGGLLSATVLTLCVIPAIYIIITRVFDRLFGEVLIVDEEG